MVAWDMAQMQPCGNVEEKIQKTLVGVELHGDAG
jgi:hypothetical protein